MIFEVKKRTDVPPAVRGRHVPSKYKPVLDALGNTGPDEAIRFPFDSDKKLEALRSKIGQAARTRGLKISTRKIGSDLWVWRVV